MRYLRLALLGLTVWAALAIFSARVLYPLITDQQAIAITSGSMQPDIPIGALAYVRAQDTYAVGDTITYALGNQNYTHKIVAEWTGTGVGPYQTQGVANQDPDPAFVNANQILGKVTGSLPAMGTVSRVLSQLPVMLFIVLVTLTIIFWPLLWPSEPKEQHYA